MLPPEVFRTWGRSRGARLPEASYEPGSLAHVVICTQGGVPWFTDRRLGEVVFRRVTSAPFTRAACLMPDHLHWLLVLEAPLSEQLRDFKSRSTRDAWAAGHGGRLWQRSFYDRVLRSSDDEQRVVRYIVENPVCAQLVDDPWDYPFTYIAPL